jgi:hypothetical protein
MFRLSLCLALLALPVVADEPRAILTSAAGGEPRAVTGEAVISRGDAVILEFPKPTGAHSRDLQFESFTVTPPDSFAVHLLGKGGKIIRTLSLPPPGHSEAWTPRRHRLEGLPAGWDRMRLDFGLPELGEIRLRHFRWLPAAPDKPASPARRGCVPANLLEADLAASYPGVIERVEVRKGDIEISGRTGGQPCLLAEVPMDRLIDDPERFEETFALQPDAEGRFVIRVPRTRQRSGLPYDRLTSRWRLVGEGDKGYFPLSHARYPSSVAILRPPPPEEKLRGKKGLGGWHTGLLPNEIEDLGIHAVTVNLIVDTLLADRASAGTVPFQWQGRTFHARRSVLERFDRKFLDAAKHDVVVSLILLVANPSKHGKTSRLAHPGAQPEGAYAMPDLVSEDGIATYGALLNLMAERWSRADGKFGRVHHWIVHNEIDAGWTWTNAGELEALPFMDLYQRSMRLSDLIVRQYDPHARAFISLTHHWTYAGSPKYYGSRKMLELLCRFTATEGDFPWAVAHHPYPESLRKPRTWEDGKTDFTFDTPKITPRNLEVLDAWMKRPEMRYQGKVRPVHLSENGFNSPDYSPKSLNDQAAGMAYAWKKMERLDSIKVWHYHNWIDNRKEGGLRIGLRRFPDDPEAPLAPKPIWHLYQALGTPAEDAACAPYLKTIGIADWSAIHTPPP